MYIGNKNNLLKNIYLLLYFVIFFLNIIYRVSFFKYILYLLGLTSVFYFFFYELIKIETKFKSKSLLFFFLIFPTMILAMFYNHNLSIASYVILISYLGIAFLMLNTIIIPEFSYIPFIINTGYLCIYYLKNNTMYAAFAEQSVNYVSVTILYTLILIYISQYQNRIKTDNYLLLILSIFLCIVAGGRGGLLSVAFLFLLTFLKNLFVKTKKNLIINVIVFTGMVLIFVYYGIIKGNIFALLGSGFSERGMDSNGRSFVWGLYLIQCLTSIKNIFFAINIQNAIPIEIFPHLHSSYLTLYADFGLLGFLCIIILLIKIFFLLFKIDKNLSFLYLAILERAVTDILFSNFAGDVFILYFILLYCISYRIIKIRNFGLIRKSI